MRILVFRALVALASTTIIFASLGTLPASAATATPDASTGTVIVRVIDPNNSPVTSAVVNLANPTTGALTLVSGVTSGIYRATGVPFGTYDLWVNAANLTSPGILSVNVNSSAPTVRKQIRLKANNATLSGTVTDSTSGIGVGGAFVAVFLRSPNNPSLLYAATFSATSDSDGSYVYSVASGEYAELQVIAAGFNDATIQPFSVPTGPSTHDFSLVPTTGSDSGRLLIEGSVVQIFDP